MSIEDKQEQIVIAVSKAFNCFGGDAPTKNNPIAHAMQGKPYSFALGVDVAEVVKFVLLAKQNLDGQTPTKVQEKEELDYEDWLKEYYPVEADSSSIKSSLDAVNHSLKKWQGLRQDVLKKYGLRQVGDYITNKTGEFFLSIDYSTCALCQKHSCSKCPIHSFIKRDCGIEWKDFVHDDDCGDPEPMIELLEKTKDYIIKKKVT